ncbi:ribosomal large subunit pseudouridine synthase B [Staphylococcus aureus]|nr:ribosomal large subunit pseudouridine synthase B [Staphylococcus aureus]
MTKELERLQKRIANSGYTSRRKAETLISEGKVKVNGTTVTELGTKVKPSDTIEVEGIKIELEDKIYILFHKPTQVITSVMIEDVQWLQITLKISKHVFILLVV